MYLAIMETLVTRNISTRQEIMALYMILVMTRVW